MLARLPPCPEALPGRGLVRGEAQRARMLRRCALGLLLGLGAVVAVLRGEAYADRAAPLFFEIGPNICGGARDLRERVARRSRNLRFAEQPQGATVVRLAVSTPGGSTVAASLEVTSRTAATWSRAFRAASCEEAFDAVAVVLVLALDQPAPSSPRGPPLPSGARQASPGRADVQGASPVATDVASIAATQDDVEKAFTPAPTPAPAPASPLAPLSPPAGARVAPTSSAASVNQAAPARVVSIEAGGGGAALLGAAPGAWPGFGGYVGLSRRGGPIFPAPAIQLGLIRQIGQTHATAGGEAAFSMTAVTLDVCPLAIGSSVELRVCGSSLAGKLRASGAQTLMPESHTRPFAAVGATVAISVRLAAGISLRTTVSTLASLVRDSFQFQPEIFHRVAPVLLVGGIFCGVQFR